MNEAVKELFSKLIIKSYTSQRIATELPSIDTFLIFLLALFANIREKKYRKINGYNNIGQEEL